MIQIMLFAAALFLAYWNGANDNFKGVATLYGSKTVSYRMAITLATAFTFAGSICAIVLAQGLVASFSGKGLVPQSIAGSADFLMAVAVGAGLTVLLATRLGFPVSTTHSLVGGLLGAGLVAVGSEVNYQQLSSAFFIPLLVSPFIAFALAGIAYMLFTRMRKAQGLTKESCLCVGQRRELYPLTYAHLDAGSNAIMHGELVGTDKLDLHIDIDESDECMDMYTGKFWGISLQGLLDTGHAISAATVSFARGLNDTPKIAGLLVAANAFDIRWGMVAIATGMAVGGLLNARRVAETISNKITQLNHGQGFTANLVTGLLVIFASHVGIPVSTTHVSVGAIFGIGLVNGSHDARVIKGILLSWLITLPIALIFSAAAYVIIS